MELQGLNGKVALVTGGSHGIGAAICKSLASEGCKISYCASGRRYPVDTTCKEVGECIYTEVNVDTFARAKFVFERTIHAFGTVDILINNLGGGSSWGNIQEWERTETFTWNEVMQHNYSTTVWFTTLALPGMKERKWGRVVAINGVYGKERGGMPWFHAAKSAQLAFMKSYSGNVECASRGITFNTVCPGFTDVGHKNKQFSNDLLSKVPAHRFGKPEDVAPLVTFLCSDNASYINGSCITIDGGMSFSI